MAGAAWITVTIWTSGHRRRTRVSSISAYGEMGEWRYVVMDGKLIEVAETEAELRLALEGTP